ncbi:MAG: pentapeptide repeat-containing protein [Proteobacteria bacterium]|nr:pentapeptide repeat-containing protein [Pseudomonadota bacterium]
MSVLNRLSQFGNAMKRRGSLVWRSAARQSTRSLQWLMFRPQAQVALFSIGMGIVTVLLLIFSSVTAAVASLAAWFALIRHFAQTNADRQRRITESFSKAIEQLGSDKLEVRLGGIYSLERISKESPDDYWTVMENLTAFVRERSRRNEADRIAEDAEQRIARRAYFLWQEAGRPDNRAENFWIEATKEEEIGGKPATDIAAVLAVISRRSAQNRAREYANSWSLDLRDAVLRRAYLSGAHLEGANLEYAHLERAVLTDAHLEKAWLMRAHLEGAFLLRAHLEGANLPGAHLRRADLTSAHLERANLDRAHLEQAVLAGAHLEGAYLNSARLEGAALPGARLEQAWLLDAHLEGANLFFAHLERATLQNAHLEGADLTSAHLRRADLGLAHLTGADLSRVDLTDVIYLGQSQIADTIGDAETKLPVGLARPAHWPDPAGAADPLSA